MTQEHPITPPPELVQQWWAKAINKPDADALFATRAAQWGADQELEACLRLVEIDAGEDAYDFARYIRAARRPKSPSLKEQALEALKHAPGPDYPNPITLLTADEHALIRRALEQIND